MTVKSDLKAIIRNRMGKTGESYTTARAHVLREQQRLLGPNGTEGDPIVGRDTAEENRVEALVIKLNQQSARVQPLGTTETITFRSTGVYRLVPGQITDLIVTKRWTFGGHQYATGDVIGGRFDISQLKLEPLRLRDHGIEDVVASSEPFRDPDPYAPYWRALTETQRRAFVFDMIAWDAIAARSPGEDICPVSDAAEIGHHDPATARDLLMRVLAEDIRCIDAHGHLGNLRFDRSPKEAMAHYEVGIAIGELSLGSNFEGLLRWGHIENRPFLRCLHGYGLCLWRLSRFEEAERVFWRILTLNPTDNQGARFCWQAVRDGESWEDFRERETYSHEHPDEGFASDFVH